MSSHVKPRRYDSQRRQQRSGAARQRILGAARELFLAHGYRSTTVARASHTATLLAKGQVLVAGGTGSRGVLLDSAELYDPGTGRWALTGSMGTLGVISHVTLKVRPKPEATAVVWANYHDLDSIAFMQLRL